MASQTGQAVITIHILSNISRSKDSQVRRFFQLIEKIFFIKKCAENEAGRLVTDLFFFKKECFIKGKNRRS